MSQLWAKIRGFVTHPVGRFSTIVSLLFVAAAIGLAFSKAELVFPGTVFVSLALAFMVLFTSWVFIREQIRSAPLEIVNEKVLLDYWETFDRPIRQSLKLVYQQLDIARRLCERTAARRLEFIRVFPGNKPEKGVYLVQADAKALQVLKFDRIENIREERDRFEMHVKGVIPNTVGRPNERWPSDQMLNSREKDTEMGAVIYDLAQLGNAAESHSRTFGEYYADSRNDGDAVTDALNTILSIVAPSFVAGQSSSSDKRSTITWWDDTNHNDVLDLFAEYKSLHRKLFRTSNEQSGRTHGQPMNLAEEVMQEVAKRTKRIQPIRTDHSEFSIIVTDSETSTPRLNPLHWFRHTFADHQAFENSFGYLNNSPHKKLSIIHGDFHAGNILIESDKELRVWLIDFPKTRIGPTVRDIACLEASLKFGCFPTKLLRDHWDEILQFEISIIPGPVREWMTLEDKQPPRGNEEQFDGEMHKLWRTLNILRKYVKSPVLGSEDARPYYLALIHATLSVLTYADRDEWQKLYAFISASLLCERLQQHTGA